MDSSETWLNNAVVFNSETNQKKKLRLQVSTALTCAVDRVENSRHRKRFLPTELRTPGITEARNL